MDGVCVSFSDLIDSVSNADTKFDKYYEGEVTLDALGISLPPAARVLEMAAPFPKLAVDVLAESLNPEGYLLGDDKETPRTLRRWWQINNLNTTVKLGIVEALIMGISYFVIGKSGTGSNVPRITVHGPKDIAVRYDHFGRVAEAVHVYHNGITEGAVHYLPGRNEYYLKSKDTGIWKHDRGQSTGAELPAIVPMINKVRIKDTFGRSEIAEIVKVTDAASRSLTNLQVAQELLAMPTRYLFGDGLSKMKDQHGNPIDKIAAYFGQFLTGPSGSEAGQIPGADLQQIINTYKLYAQNISSVTGIPPSMLGISTDNPSSADAMRVAKERLIAKAEVKQAMFGDSLEDLAKIALQIGGIEVEDVELLELQWRDPALSSVSAKSANLLQAHSQGVITAATARDGLQLTPEQKAREDQRETSLSRRASQMGA